MYTPITPIEAINPYEGMSKKYQFISTKDVITTFNEQGFEVSSVKYPKVRNHSKLGFNSHIVRMRQTNCSHYTEEVPEILIINSHDGTKAFRLGLGFFRFICENGLIVGDFMADTGRVTHKGQAATEVLKFVSEYSKNVSEKIKRITYMKHTILSSSGIEEFEQRARDIINPSIVDAHQLTYVNRLNDKEPTVWNTFNTIQENAMKGKFYVTNNTKTRKARPVNNIDRNISINTKLWNLAEEFVYM